MTIEAVVLPTADLGVAGAAEALQLARAAAATDGVFPLSEQGTLALRPDSARCPIHVLAKADHRVVGYAQVEIAKTGEDAVSELVVHPASRRRGVGTALLSKVSEVAPGGRVRLWAHGALPSAAGFAQALDLTPRRVLWQLRRSLLWDIPEPKTQPGVRIRAFRPGRDDLAWLSLNRSVFADHPEQGGWTLADLRARFAEPWFRAEDFLLAEGIEDEALVGFHWTKRHPGCAARPAIGEVYVIGVSPPAHGTGLGRALLLTGLRHLRRCGLGQVMLYVDESNQPAVGLYRKLGFTHYSTDVCYEAAVPGRPVSSPRSTR